MRCNDTAPHCLSVYFPKGTWEPVYWLQSLLLRFFLRAHATLMTKSRSLPCSPSCHQSQKLPLTLFVSTTNPPPPTPPFVHMRNTLSLQISYPLLPLLFILQNKQTQVDRLIGFYTKVTSLPALRSVFKPTLKRSSFLKNCHVVFCVSRKGRYDWNHVEFSSKHKTACVCQLYKYTAHVCMHIKYSFL